jgi:hypothetical protein
LEGGVAGEFGDGVGRISHIEVEAAQIEAGGGEVTVQLQRPLIGRSGVLVASRAVVGKTQMVVGAGLGRQQANG